MKFDEMKFLEQNGYRWDKMGWMRKWLDKKETVEISFGFNAKGIFQMMFCKDGVSKWHVTTSFNFILLYSHEYFSYRKFEELYENDDTFKLGLGEVANLILKKLEVCDEQ